MTNKILVADDDEANRELLKEILDAQGLEVTTAADGLTALQEVVRYNPDLVLLDAAMPFVDGFETCGFPSLPSSSLPITAGFWRTMTYSDYCISRLEFKYQD